MMRILSIATAALLSVTCAGAQSTQGTSQTGTSQAKPSAYGSSYPTASSSQYQGVAQPPNDPIVADQPASPNVAQSPVEAGPAAPPSTDSANPLPKRTHHATTTPAENPDYGILTTPVSANQPALATANMASPTLKSHYADADDDIVTSVPGDPNQLPQGTPFHARLVEEISADTVTPGTPFTAQLTRDVTHMDRVVIPIGSYIHGRVTYVSAGRRIGGQSTMRLTPDEVVLPDGTHYHFRGIVTQTAGSNTKTDSEGYVINKDHAVRTGAEYGMTAGSGAIIGAVVAGPVGAGVGGAIGAGVMTVHWLREKNAAVLPAGSFVTFALSSPLALTPSAVGSPNVTSTVNNPSIAPYAQPAPQTPPVSTYVEPKIVN